MLDGSEILLRHYPFRANRLNLDGPRMHYVDEGQGHPLVMLHGNPTWSFYYRRLIRELRDWYRVIAPDHVGCGLSDKPQRYAYTLSTHIDNLERLIDHLELDDITLVVHDWGGAIGFGYAARHPQRVRRFVVLNSAAFFGRLPLRIRVCRTPWLGTLAVRGCNAFSRIAVHMACNRRSMPDDVRAGYLLPYNSFANRVAVHRFIEDIPTRPSHPTFPVMQAIERSLPQFRDRPMAIFWGAADFCFTSAFLKGWQQRFPNAEVHHFADAGHYVLEDAVDRIMPLLREFLARTA